MAKNFMQRLQKHEAAVVQDYNPFAHIIRTPSPSANFIFGKTHGLPLGYTAVLWGPPKGGKSLLCNAMIGQLHLDDPEAIAVKFNTEMREMGQLSDEQAKLWGIDRKRYVAYDTNTPDGIFDWIEKEIAAACQDGAKIKLIIIDSITGIQGRRAMNADTVMTQQIGDEAKTLQDGLKRILPIQRKYKIALILTAHTRAEMDMAEQMRGNKTRMAAAFAVQHHCEYFVHVEPNKTAKGKANSVTDEKFEDESVTDFMKHGERLGHKIRVTMKDSSMGPKGRTGEFTLDYERGIINVAEEVFLLGVNRNIVDHPTNNQYVLGDRKWSSKASFYQALVEEPDLQAQILGELKRRDLAGGFRASDAKAEAEAEETTEAEE